MRTTLTMLGIVLLSTFNAGEAQAAPIVVLDGSGNVTQIQNLSVTLADTSTVLFDVTFDGVNRFDDLFGSSVPPMTTRPYFWGNSTDAGNARDAIISTLNSQTTVPPIDLGQHFPTTFAIPYGGTTTTYDAAGGTYATTGYTTAPIGSATRGDLTNPNGPPNAIGTFQVVPEPSSFALMGIAAIGFAGYTRRRMRKGRR